MKVADEKAVARGLASARKRQQKGARAAHAAQREKGVIPGAAAREAHKRYARERRAERQISDAAQDI